MSVKLPNFLFKEKVFQNPLFLAAFARLLHITQHSGGSLCLPRQELAALLGLGSRGTLNKLLDALSAAGYVQVENIPAVGTRVTVQQEQQYYARSGRAVCPAKRAAFVPPTADEVRAYCAQRGYTIDPQAFVDYYAPLGWTYGKKRTPMTDWKKAVVTWQKNNFNTPEPFDPVAPRNDPQRFFQWFLEELHPQVLKAPQHALQAFWRQNKGAIDSIFAFCATLPQAEAVTAFAVNKYRKNGLTWNLYTVAKSIISLSEEYESVQNTRADQQGGKWE